MNLPIRSSFSTHDQLRDVSHRGDHAGRALHDGLILAFNFYPVTAVMIILLSLLNNGANLSIAYDRARHSNRPEVWNMLPVLGMTTVLGLTGVASPFELFYLAEHTFRLDRAMIQSLIYLRLSVAGHMTVFVARARGPFWSIPPPILLAAVIGTQLVATCIAVYGVYMPSLGWNWTLFVWSIALVWLFIEDRVELLGHRIFDCTPSGPVMETLGEEVVKKIQ